MLPELDVNELRRRIAVGADVPDTVLRECLDVARAVIDPKVDATRMPETAPAYREGCYQFAAKVWDTQGRGMVGMDPTGVFESPPQQATAGMLRAVYGVLAPCLRHGGVTVA